MSKSGLYAHFKSKEELELATIETAAEIFEREVLAPAGESPAGLARVWALAEAFLGHLERRVFPGGCFFATVSAQLASRPGAAPRPGHGHAAACGWSSSSRPWARPSRAGELPGDADVGQLVFEITAMLVRANFTWILTGSPRVLDRARVGIRHVLERASGPGRRRRDSRSR